MQNQTFFADNSSDFALPDRSTPVDRNSPIDPIDPTETTAPTDADMISPDATDTTSVDGAEIFDLGIFDSDVSGFVTDDLTSNTPGDVYQFVVDQSNDFSFILDGLSADADLSIYDENFELLATSENYDLESEALEGNLIEGTYYLGVTSFDGVPTDYDLTVSSGEFAYASTEMDSSADFT